MAGPIRALAQFAQCETTEPLPLYFEKLNRPASKVHRIRIHFTPTEFDIYLALYDSLAWGLRGNGATRDNRSAQMPEFFWKQSTI